MSFDFGKQIAYCHRRAAECRQLAVRYCARDREHYFRREQVWLTLARIYESQQRVDHRLTELELSVDCFSVRIACAVFSSVLGARTQILPSRDADVPIILPRDPAARWTRR